MTRLWLGALAALLATALVSFVGLAGASPQPGSPRAPGDEGELYAIDALAPNNVWAAGWEAVGNQILPIVRHFDGTAWRTVDVPVIGEAQIKGIAALAPDNVWMVGELWGPDVAFALHWNGSTLSEVPVQRPGLWSNLDAVAAGPGGELWAVGDYTQWQMPHKVRSLVERWNGSSWQIVSSPNVDGPWYNELTAVRSYAPGDAWAAGWTDYGPILLHWDGASWSFRSTPDGGEYDRFNGLTGSSSADLWVAGAQEDVVARHWNGSRWTSVDGHGDAPSLFGATAVPGLTLDRGRVFGVGVSWSTGQSRTRAVLVTGNRWVVTPTPNPGTRIYGNQLYAVDALSASQAWAAGTGDGPMILRWDGRSWSIAYGG